jgi:predicted ATP-grasp superfamily ATP-dependent carboligase
MPTCSKEEISAILHAAEILKRNGFSEQINVSHFCKEAGISRKNAYKHKKNINVSVDSLEQKVRELEQAKQQVQSNLEYAEQRAREADLYWELRNILVALPP